MSQDYDWVQLLVALEACTPALEWAADQGAASVAWAECPRGDWMLWLAARAGVDRRLVVLAACDCARLALPVWEDRYRDDARPRTAIETAERWARNEASARDAASAADAAACAGSAAYSACGPGCALADAAHSAGSAAYTAVRVHERAYSPYVTSATYAALAAARAGTHRRCADAIRARIPTETIRMAMLRVAESYPKAMLMGAL